MKNRGDDAKFKLIDINEAHVMVDGYFISERSNLMNDWNSVLIKGNDTRICRRYNGKSIARSIDEDLSRYVSPEILDVLRLLEILK